jgi:TetR/AcrR family transcriptional repressor of nem operon
MTRITAKEKLIEAALALMAEKDYMVTTVDEICEKAGVSKGSFYHFFETKEDLGLAAMSAFFQFSMEEVAAADFMKLPDPIARALGYLDFMDGKAEQLQRTGCLYGNFAVGAARTHPRLQSRVSEVFAEFSGAVSVIFAPFASEDGSDGLPTAVELAELYLSILEGSIVMARAHRDADRIRKGSRWFRHYLESLIVA